MLKSFVSNLKIIIFIEYLGIANLKIIILQITDSYFRYLRKEFVRLFKQFVNISQNTRWLKQMEILDYVKNFEKITSIIKLLSCFCCDLWESCKTWEEWKEKNFISRKLSSFCCYIPPVIENINRYLRSFPIVLINNSVGIQQFCVTPSCWFSWFVYQNSWMKCNLRCDTLLKGNVACIGS